MNFVKHRKVAFTSIRILLAIVLFPLFESCYNSVVLPLDECVVEVLPRPCATLVDAQIIDISYTFYNVSTGRSRLYRKGEVISLLPGLYNVSCTGEAQKKDNPHICQIQGRRESIDIKPMAEIQRISLDLVELLSKGDFIIREIFFTGTLFPSGKQYHGDNYVVLYNNTDHVLYADGVALTESTFTSVQKFDYQPDLRETDFSVEAIYVVPGSGKEYPVQPGEDFVICDTGIDHRKANPNSFDLSKANVEWYDISSSPNWVDFDSPLVPNLDKWYCYTRSIWILHNRGFRSYAIARIPLPKEQYLVDYLYTYKYVISLPTGDYPMERKTYRLPNKWILDGVNCSVEAKYLWNILPPTIDAGWTHCGTIDAQKDRYFHSVRRKVKEILPGKGVILLDTNNSTEDFNPFVTPSIIEQQHSAIDAAGTNATSITHDGVMPVEQ